MIERDQKLERQAKWLETHTLTPEQFKQLIQNKFVRAAQYHEASRKREAVCGHR